MRHLLEAIVRTQNSELRLPELTALAQNEGGYRMRRSEAAATTLNEMLEMELQLLVSDPRTTIANINPLRRHRASDFFNLLTNKIDMAAGANAFGDAPTQTYYKWMCTNEEPANVPQYEVYPGNRDGTNTNRFYALCPTHDQEEEVNLVETDDPEEVEDVNRVWQPDEAFRILRVPQYIIDYYNNRTTDLGDILRTTVEGRLLWEERLPYTNELTGQRERGWFVHLNTGHEVHLPSSIMSPVGPRRTEE